MIPPLSSVLATPLFIAECYWPGVTPALMREADARTQLALPREPGVPGVRQAGSILVPTDELVLRLFLGGSAQQVEAINEQAAVPFERVVSAVVIDGVQRPSPDGPVAQGSS